MKKIIIYAIVQKLIRLLDGSDLKTHFSNGYDP